MRPLFALLALLAAGIVGGLTLASLPDDARLAVLKTLEAGVVLMFCVVIGLGLFAIWDSNK